MCSRHWHRLRRFRQRQRAKGKEPKQSSELAATIRRAYSLSMQISPQSSQADIERFAARAKQAYKEKIASLVEPEHIGEIIAIEPDSETYFLGQDEVEAADKGHAAGVYGPFYFMRVGSPYAHRIMSPRR